MNKKKMLHRLLAFVLAVTFILGSAITVGAATESGGSTTDKTLAELREKLNAISYQEYCALYAQVPRATGDPIVILGTENVTYEGNSEIDTDFDLPDGSKGVFTPNVGVTTWKVPNIPVTAKYSIVIEYYPDDAKTASIERILMINDKIPFAEARYITLPKVWKNQYVVAKIDAEEFDMTPDALKAEAIEAGFADAATVTEKEKTFVTVSIPSVWTEKLAGFVNKYSVRFMEADIDDNELRPKMEQKPELRAYELRDANGFYAETFEFVFEAGTENTISLESVNEPMTVKSITLIPHVDLSSYDVYVDRFANMESGKDFLNIQAEYNDATSSQTVYPLEDRTDAATMPSNTSHTVLNTIGGEKWQTSGQWVRYTFKVETSGMYNIGARYRQNVLDGMYVCRALRIASNGAAPGTLGYYDGSSPFVEATQLRFNYGSSWQSCLFNDGSVDENGDPINYKFYFEAGVEYTVMLEVGLGSTGDIVRRVEASLNAINNDYLEIMRLTGASPDEFRDYGFFRVMPDVMIDMIIQSRELYDVAAKLAEITGEKSSNVATLERVAWLLERMGSDENEIAKYLEQLKSYIGSLGSWLGDAKTQPLQLDYLTIQPTGGEAPEAEAGFFASIWHEIKSFIMSFFRNYDRMGAISEEVDETTSIDVWIATGRDQAQVLRSLINDKFNKFTKLGTTVNLKLVAGGTLLPSVLAGMGPDVYIGVGEDSVINYAIRGALLPIENMPGFKEYALPSWVDENGNVVKNPNANFNEAAMIVLGIEDSNDVFHYYGLPETQNFTMMFVREDIFADLGLEIPRTWDDVLAAIPTLQANNMQIGMHADYKIFLYQMGGELFADNGMRINLDSNVGLESFETMCGFFTKYSFPRSYDFANRFRTGEMPIGFASYNGTYNHLIVFATEIKGLWGFYPMPGIRQADGSINNVTVATTSAIVMMNGCGDDVTEEGKLRRERAWEFMMWHSGAECQIDYSNEMVAIIGPSAKHATANVNALSEMPWTYEEYEQLQYQFNNLASIPNYPGSYIIGRYTNFAFLAAYNDNANPTDELQSYITIINKEITRKREEFGLETLEIGQTLKSKRLTQAKEAFEADLDELGRDHAYLERANAVMKDYLSDLAREDYDRMDTFVVQNAIDDLSGIDAGAFANTIKALQRALLVV